MIDKKTLATCLVALDRREFEAARQGLSTRDYTRAKRIVKGEILRQSAEDMRADIPVFLQKQAC